MTRTPNLGEARCRARKPRKDRKTMKQKLLELAFEFLLTKETAKKLARTLNKKLAENAALDGGKAKYAGYLRDGMATLAVYSEAVADDGRISDAELEKINAQTDALIDKYIK